MIKPENHFREKERLKELESFSILDSLSESDYDNITAIAAEICRTPIALVSLIDERRQWFKSHHGLSVSETPKEYAFCTHAINDPSNVFIVTDARNDIRFHDNPLVTGDPHVIFYAGVPLITENGLPLGTLCVIDNKPHLLSQSQKNSLEALARQVMNLLELRKNRKLLENALNRLEEKNQELDRFAFIAAHDLKSPLAGISGLTHLFSKQYISKIDKEGELVLKLIEGSADKLRKMIDGLLEYSRSESIIQEKKSQIILQSLKDDIVSLFSFENNLTILLNSPFSEIYSNRTALEQIFINLISNAIKYNDKNQIIINIGVSENETHYCFYVQDNGPGIAVQDHEKIFKIFEKAAPKDRYGLAGNGIGLATVKKIVQNSGGSLKVESSIGNGANFIFTVEK